MQQDQTYVIAAEIGYEMKRHKSVDRLSELPESLILCILSFLEMRDVVKTSLLSKGWKDLWTTIPSLNFNETEKNLVQTRNFINGVIRCWRGTTILRFRIKFGKTYDASLSGDVDYWVGFATERKVEDLNLLVSYNNRGLDPVLLPPQCLNSCSSIKKLRLYGYSFRMNNVQWDQLKTLVIGGYCIKEDLVSQLVSSAPRLIKLKASLAGSHQKLNIRSRSLRRLILWIRGHDPLNCTTLTIWAPKLIVLEVEGRFSTCLPLKIRALSHACLLLKDTCVVRLEATLKQVLPATRYVERLVISLSCFKMLGVMKNKYLFPNVKYLKLFGGPNKHYDIADINEYFPKMERLHIVWGRDTSLFLENVLQKRDIVEKCLEVEAKKLNPILMHLRELDLYWYDCDDVSMFQFIKRLLKHATMLQKIVIRTQEDDVFQSEVMVLAAQELLSLQKSFPTIDIISVCEK